MKKRKILKIVMLVITIILIVFVIATTRKVIILTSLKNKVAEYSQISNLHMKTETEDAMLETFMKKDIYKTIFQSKEQNSTITHITDYNTNEGRTYWDSKDGKVLQIKRNNEFEFLKVTPIYTFADSISFFETIINSVVSRIYTESIDGEEYYVIEGMRNTNFICGENTINVKGYVNKETGLRTKMVETVKQDGEKKTRITTYEYSFDNITAEDLKEPNRDEYKIIEE